MDARQFQNVAALFDQLIALPAARRASRLQELCVDAALRKQVAELLRADARGMLLEQALCKACDDALMRVAAEGVERPLVDEFGIWRIVREIGRGGMGVVYLVACTIAGCARRGALKLVGDGMATAPTAARFRRESEWLARLRHPAIVRLLDAGVSATGRAYFVMEYVVGRSLAQYVEQRTLSLSARLGLFITLCDAVAYAHAQDILHGDIKPSNVIVTAQGRVKLLDFGSAEQFGSAACARRSRSAPLTPDYAAPEQLRRQSATVASDVYALGGLLYLLLTGVRPRQSLAAGRSIAAQLQAAAEVVAPSVRAAALARSSAACVALPSQALGVELDRITMTALQVDPQQRHASVQVMADEVRAFLAAAPADPDASTQPRSPPTGGLGHKRVRRG